MTLTRYRRTAFRTHRAAIVALILLLLTGSATQLLAGVLVAPTVIFISDKDRTGRLNIQNPSDEPREISIHLAFGLPESDSLGNVFVTLQDSGVTDPRSALDWIKAFPRKVIVPPNGTQVIRLVARPPQNLADGEYWARVVVTSREGSTAMPLESEGDAIQTHLNMVMQTALMLKYRSGECVAKLEVTDKDARLVEGQVNVVVDMQNSGNTSYMGVVTCRLYDKSKKLVTERNLDVAVYRSLKRRIELPFDTSQFSGPFSVDVTISSDGRTDVAPEDMIPGNRIEYSLAVD
jgi:P pilus assembly chaperone PapD